MITVLERIVRMMKNIHLLSSCWSINRYAFWINFTFCLLVSADGLAVDGDVRVDDGSLGVERDLPSIALDKESNIYVVWQDDRERMWIWNVYFAKSTDGGRTFGPNVRVGSSSMWAESVPPSIAVNDSGTIYVAWYDEGPYIEDYDIYVSKSIDGGASFSPRVRVDNGGASAALNPALAIDRNGTIFIAWQDDREIRKHIYMNRSTNGGETFDSTDIRIDNDLSSGSSSSASFVIDDSSSIYVSWTYWEQRSSIYFNRSEDGGSTFGLTPIQVDDGIRDCYFSKLAVDSRNNIYVVWFAGGYVDGTDIYFDKSNDGGDSFGSDIRVNDVDSTGYWPHIATDGKGDIFVVWQKRMEDSDIYFSMSHNGGVTFSEDIRVDHQEWGSTHPSVAADDSGNVYVVWEQQTQFYGVSDAIFFTKFNAFTTIGKMGDVNLDGEVNILDIVLVVNIILESIPTTGYQEWAADINFDSVINVIDVILIVNFILKNGSNTSQ